MNFFYFFSVHVLLYLYNFGGVSARLQGSNSLECFLNALLGTCLNYNILLEKLIDLQQHLVIHRHSCKLKHFKYLNWNSRVGLLSPDVSQQTQTGLELDGLSWALIWTFLIPRAVFSDPSLCRASSPHFVFKYQQVKCDRKLSLSADGRAHTGFFVLSPFILISLRPSLQVMTPPRMAVRLRAGTQRTWPRPGWTSGSCSSSSWDSRSTPARPCAVSHPQLLVQVHCRLNNCHLVMCLQ